MRTRRGGTVALMAAVVIGVAGCDEGTTTPEPETVLLSVAPAGEAVDVALDAPVVVTFDHAMHGHAADYAAVHEGDVTGPVVEGSWMMEENGTVMRFTPGQDWKAGMEYTIHLGGGMTDVEGHHVDMGTHGTHMGGEWATGSMMGGTHGAGMNGSQHGHTGAGWEHPENGSYGMLFTFTTAA